MLMIAVKRPVDPKYYMEPTGNEPASEEGVKILVSMESKSF